MKNPLYALALSIYIIAGCTSGSDGSQRSDIQKKRLAEIDDSVTALSPEVPAMIERGLHDAADSLDWYDFYLRYAKYYQLSQSPDSVLPYADRIIAFTGRQQPSPRVNGIKAMAYESKAVYWQRYRSNLDEAVRLRTTAYNSMMESDDTGFLPEMCANMADTYVQMNDMAQAASWYRRALFLVDSLQLPDIKNVTLYLGLAQIYMNLDDYDASLRYYRDSGQFYDRMPPNMKVYYLNNFGNYYYFRGQYEQALGLFVRLRELLTGYGDDGIDMAVCRINLADVYLNLGRVAEAAECLDLAEQFFADKGIGVGLYYANSIRIGMAVKQGRTADVRRLLAAETVGPPLEYGLVRIRNRYLREYYKAMGDYRAALVNMESDIHARDSIDDSRQHMRASEIMQRLKEDTLMLHHAIEMQQKDAALRNTHLTAAAVAVVAVLFLLWLVAYSRKRKLQTEMDMMQLRLDNARNRISPHFIFNVLNSHISTTGKKEADELMALVRLIRTNLDISRNTFVSLADEMKFVRYYTDIERSMMDGDLTVSVDAPPESVLAAVSIPTMFVQILAENAIKHGLKGKEGPKRLDIVIRCGERGTDITVSDNGGGFDIRSVTAGGTRTGLDIIRHTIRIINERMKRGDGMTFAIANRKAPDGTVTGCDATLHIPSLPLPGSGETT